MRRILYSVLLITLALPLRIWSDTITLQDGTRHTGVYLGGTSRTITFQDEQGATHRYDIQQVKSVEFNTAEKPSASPAEKTKSSAAADPARKSAAQPVVKMIPSGTELMVRTNENIDSKTATAGQKFSGMITQDVKDTAGEVAIPKDSDAELVIRQVSSGGAVGTSDLVLDVDSVTINGQKYLVSTANLEQKGREGVGKNKRTAEMIGGGAGLGALIGAIAGKGKGAALGAVIGAAAGGTAQIVTKGKEVRVPAESVLTFHLDQDLRLERQG